VQDQEPTSPNAAPIVLVVDDDKNCRELCAQYLRVSGFSVSEAHNGNQALSMAMERPPSLVITDLALPGIDGYALARKLRAQRSTATLPILAITGRGEFMSDAARALAAGCNAFLPKPFSLDRLLEEVERLLEQGERLPAR